MEPDAPLRRVLFEVGRDLAELDRYEMLLEYGVETRRAG